MNNAIQYNNRANKAGMKVAKSLFLWIGILFLVLGYGFNKSYSNLKERCSEVVTAKVSQLRESTTEDGTVYYATFEYTVNGKEYSVEDSWGLGNTPYKTGDKVEIHYNPDKPKEIYTNTVSGNIFVIIFMTVGIIFIIVGLIFKIVIKRMRYR